MNSKDKNQIELLKTILLKNKSKYQFNICFLEDINILDYYIDEIVGLELIKYGFDSKGDIIGYGNQLEELIDYLNNIRFSLDENNLC